MYICRYLLSLSVYASASASASVTVARPLHGNSSSIQIALTRIPAYKICLFRCHSTNSVCIPRAPLSTLPLPLSVRCPGNCFARLNDCRQLRWMERCDGDGDCDCDCVIVWQMRLPLLATCKTGKLPKRERGEQRKRDKRDKQGNRGKPGKQANAFSINSVI